MKMADRLALAGFMNDPHGLWLRIDDVYETTVSLDDEPGAWMVAIYNAESDADPVRFRATEEGKFLDANGTDRDTVRTLFPEILIAEQLFMQQNGRIVCPAHGGSYLQSALEDDPRAFDITTPLDHWERINYAWGPHPPCEDCASLSPCCGATKTYVEGVLSCKNCYEAVPA